MINVLQTDKQITIIAALAEGSSICSIERMTGVHRDTIMRLGVKVGQGCTALMDSTMRDLTCNRLEMDEIWGFIGKKDRHVRDGDDPRLGNVWPFCAIDAEIKLVPAFRVGNRDAETAVGLHFAYYNFVRRHNTIRCTPAMAAGVTPTFWTAGDLVEATA
ncbi:helix-turn-helix domain-containing protein [Granulicella sp. WH15]|uniref:helix-turn-helix domain-containing protein n=1 Tax=Granulicella sp. WH15 TaxID=2602070 RepID=UPI001366DDAC|nr:helix-turn-helix domain-containing protein [Granulicella sp. WH15]QHN02747.1 helix-turn-helix domain-containing protein [Granulicella sp. WH15]